MGYFRGTTRNPPAEWADVQLARGLNRYLGTQIAPWELGAVPEIWVDIVVEGVALERELGEAGLLD